jgi:glycine/D-amino acid oxidase-like deaminating enzyme
MLGCHRKHRGAAWSRERGHRHDREGGAGSGGEGADGLWRGHRQTQGGRSSADVILCVGQLNSRRKIDELFSWGNADGIGWGHQFFGSAARRSNRGGIVGCATAYQLARAGFKVTLIERDAIAAHASSRNAGHLNPLYGTTRALISFALGAFRIHQEIRSELTHLGCANYTASPVKRILLGYGEADRSHLEETAALLGTTASTWLDQADLCCVEPRLARDVAFGVPDPWQSRGGKSRFDSIARDERAGFWCHNPASVRVRGHTISGEFVIGVQTDEDVIDCDEFILATGPRVADTKSWLGIDVAVEPAKGELLLSGSLETPRSDLSWA